MCRNPDYRQCGVIFQQREHCFAVWQRVATPVDPYSKTLCSVVMAEEYNLMRASVDDCVYFLLI